MLAVGPPHRRFELAQANLSGQFLWYADLRDAYLTFANLQGTDLTLAT
jgi:uncharacterized protein YjbI with pentapeptide repeats